MSKIFKTLLRGSFFISLMLIVSVTLTGCSFDIGKILDGITNVLDKVVSGIGNIVTKVVDVAKSAVNTVKEYIIQPIAKGIQEFAGKVSDVANSVKNGINSVDNAFSSIGDESQTMLDKNSSLKAYGVDSAGNPVSSTNVERQGVANSKSDTSKIEEVGNKVSNAINKFSDKLNSGVDKAKDAVNKATDKVNDTKNAINDAVNNVKDSINDTKDSIKDTVDNIKDSVKDTKNDIKNAVSDVKDSFKNAVNDTKNNIKDSVNSVKNETKNTVNSAKDSANSAKDAVNNRMNNLAEEIKSVLGDSAKVEVINGNGTSKAQSASLLTESEKKNISKNISDGCKQLQKGVDDLNTLISKNSRINVYNKETVKEVSSQLNDIERQIAEIQKNPMTEASQAKYQEVKAKLQAVSNSCNKMTVYASSIRNTLLGTVQSVESSLNQIGSSFKEAAKGK